MLNTLLFVHLIIAILLVIAILLQKTGTDGLSGISGGGNNMGLVSGKTVVGFLNKTTVILGILFFVNAIILANLSTRSNLSAVEKLQESEKAVEENASVPMAK